MFLFTNYISNRNNYTPQQKSRENMEKKMHWEKYIKEGDINEYITFE